jgi:hypothetical protein
VVAIAGGVTRDITAPTIRDTMAGAVAAVAITVAAAGVAASVTVDAEAAADAAGAAAGVGGAAGAGGVVATAARAGGVATAAPATAAMTATAGKTAAPTVDRSWRLRGRARPQRSDTAPTGVMTLRAAQGWLGQRSIASTPVDRPWGGPGFKDLARERYRPEVSIRHWIARRHVLFLPLARTFCWLPDTISFAEPVRGAHPPTGRARTKAPAVRRGFRFVIFARTRRWRECHGARTAFAIDGHAARFLIHQRLTMIALKPTMIATRIVRTATVASS